MLRRRPAPPAAGGQSGKSRTHALSRGDSHFDKIQSCKHDLTVGRDPLLCPFCKLVRRELDTYFSKEREDKERARHESLIRRASQRFNLLQGWARNQALYYHELLPTSMCGNATVVELSFSKELVNALISEAELKEEQEESSPENSRESLLDPISVSKILTRRRRILEVGKYAATFLQARIRKWCSQRRTRHMLLRRFELVPANPTLKRGSFFVDQKMGRKCNQLPQIIQNERPNTPRTINRRIAGIERVQDERVRKFKAYMKRFIVDGQYKNLWVAEEQAMQRTRNFVVLLDLVTASFASLRRLNVPGEADSSAHPESAQVAWLSISAPGPPSRLFGLSLAVATPTFVESFPQLVAKSKPKSKPAATTASATKATSGKTSSLKGAKSTSGSKVNVSAAQDAKEEQEKEEEEEEEVTRLTLAQINSRIQSLETRAWECLRCDGPMDVLSKLTNPELHPPMSSCIHIARDEYRIWRGDLETEVPAKKHPTEDNDDTHTQLLPTQLLPISIQLRAFRGDRDPSSVFRLFFFEGEFVAATQTCTFCLWPEVLRDKDVICQSLLAYAESPDVTAFCCAYFKKANASSREGGKGGGATAPPTKFTTHALQICVPFYIPSQEELFGNASYLDRKAALTAEETVACSKQYKFLSKVSEFKPLLVKAQNALMRSKRAAPEVTRPTMPSAGDPRIGDVPPLDDLGGTNLFREYSVQIPGGHVRREEEYAEKLSSLSLLTDPIFHPRINKPAILAAEELNNPNESSREARYDLLVMEVNVAPGKASGIRPCNIHQVVGVIDCKDPRPPPHLDCGLIPWSFFLDKRLQAAEDARIGIKPPWTRGGSRRLAGASSLPTWSIPDGSSGCMTSSNLKTGSSREIRVAIIGALPSKDHLMTELSNKQLRWIGLDS